MGIGIGIGIGIVIGNGIGKGIGIGMRSRGNLETCREWMRSSEAKKETTRGMRRYGTVR